MVVGGVFGSQRAGNTSDAAAAQKTIGTQGSACYLPTSATVTSACSSLSSALSSNGTNAQLEESMLIGGGVLLAVGLVTAFWPGGRDKMQTAGIAPSIGPHNAGLQWTGSF
jgi:hypothetical protein